MPYRLTPPEIVTMLEECIQNVEEITPEKGRIENIKQKLKIIKDYYPNLKKLEKKIIEEFIKVGCEISRDDILKKHDDPNKKHDDQTKGGGSKNFRSEVESGSTAVPPVDPPTIPVPPLDPILATKIKERLQSIDDILTGIKTIIEQNKISPQSMSPTEAKKVSGPQESISIKESAGQWSESDLESRILESKAMSSLRICFDNLDCQSRLCSLCLSIFPENVEIKKRPLIYWWIGEGFIKGTGEMEAEDVGEGFIEGTYKTVAEDVGEGKDKKVAEDVGEDVFKKLYRKGLVQPVYKGQNPIVDSCFIHPWVRKMLIAVAREAQFLDFEDNGLLKETFNASRRACLVEANERSLLKNNELNLDMLAVVFNVDKKYLQLESELWSNLKRVKALQLGRWQRKPEHHIELEIIGDAKKVRDDSQDVLINLGAMKQLKYLSLQGISRISKLPNSLSELLNLEILDLRACHNLESLPSAIGSLHNLTHLDVTECYFLESMPKGIERLTSLEVLKGFMLGAHETNSCKLRDLARLTKLRKLSIYIRNKAHRIEEQGGFEKNEKLRSLTMTWGGGTSGTKQGTQQKPMEFPESLEKLDLRCYPSGEAPEWLSPTKLKNLKKLYVRGGLLENLGDFKYHDLKILRLKYLKKMEVSLKEDEKGVPVITINGKEEKFSELEYYEMARCEEDDKIEVEEWTKGSGEVRIRTLEKW